MELHPLFTGATPASPSTALRALERRRFPSIRTQIVVFAAILRIAENLVRFVDLLEFFLRVPFVFGDIRMILTGQFSESLLDILRAGIPRYTQDFVIVFELNRHADLLLEGHFASHRSRFRGKDGRLLEADKFIKRLTVHCFMFD